MSAKVYMAPERVDRGNAAGFQKDINQLLDGGADHLVVDMAGLKYISSAGLRVLLETQQKMGDSRTFAIRNVPSAVKEILDVTGFSSFLKIE